MTSLWHYSKAGHLEEIFEAGTLNLATIGVPANERPALWLSSNPFIERTAYPSKMTLAELEDSAYQPVRFLLNPKSVEAGTVKLVSWKKHRQKGRMIPQHAKDLEKVARSVGANCADWWCSYQPISVECFLHVDIMKGGKWELLATREPDKGE